MVVEYIGTEKIRIEEGRLVRVDARDVRICEFVGRAEMIEIAVDDTLMLALHGMFESNRKL